MPNPPRMLVLPSPQGSHAKPKRGAQSFLSGKFAPLGAPGSPGNTRPVGALTNRCDCWPGIIENDLPCVSSLGDVYSYRTPRFTVSRLLTCHSSCAYANEDWARILDGAAPN